MDNHSLLKEIQAKLLGIELNLDLTEQSIEEIGADINFLGLMEEETVYNINFLKKNGIVADLKTYRQSWVKLSHIRTKTQQLMSKKGSLNRELEKQVKAKEYYDLEWDKLHRAMEDDKIVLVFKRK